MTIDQNADFHIWYIMHGNRNSNHLLEFLHNYDSRLHG